MGDMTEHLALPDSALEETAVGARFRQAAQLVERCNSAVYGDFSPRLDYEQALIVRRGTSAESVATLVHGGDPPEGLADIFLPMTESTETADTMLFVDPDLGAERRRAVFESLVDACIRYAREIGRSTVLGGGLGAASGPITAATGFGGVRPDDPESAAWLERGATLSQVYRSSRLSLADLDNLPERLQQAQSAASGYDTLTWIGETPGPWRDDMCRLHERMSTDSPTGDLELGEQQWSDARLAEFEQHKIGNGRLLLTSAIQHEATGALVGYSQMLIGKDSLARQHNLIVSREHRGNGLGLILKLAGLVLLREAAPHATAVSTMNAEENRHMLRVNEATGFATVTHLAVFQLRLGA